ncbi:phage tail protein [Aeromicrobium sp. Root495]|uniref:siderophore-interacting protein n=1 Tax=Aeromicrobium sp. Root495 TaxID=1736550 RepID=UPI0006FBBCF3|nr:siderophore-interacting protein [Aeromicrobium sp. Root495]KQY55955.1 phage tail protein [Aeromicrobium sp. Root495]
MAKASKLVKPDRTRLIKLQVLRTERISTHFQRVTVGGGSIEHFVPMGYDQWFRLFIPTTDDAALDRLPDKVSTIGYLKYLRINAEIRPVLRNYTVRAYRAEGPQGPEIDIDLVLHGSAADGTAGPGSSWAETCVEGDWIGIVDEGLVFDPGVGQDDVLLVADETGVPAVAGVLASLPDDAQGLAVLEVQADDDVLDLPGPPGVEQRWIVRGPDAVPGAQALAEVEKLDVRPTWHAFAVGESGLATGTRRHLVARGLAKDRVNFCGFWKIGVAG